MHLLYIALIKWLKSYDNLVASAYSEAQRDMASAIQRSTKHHNIVFVNIDWAVTRHDTEKSIRKNKAELQSTIESIVAEMRPDILCMCEVGHPVRPMTDDHMKSISEWCKETWKRTTTSRAVRGKKSPEFLGREQWLHAQNEISLSVVYTVNEPYMTIYDNKKCVCLQNTILSDLYEHCNEPRTAQYMLFRSAYTAESHLQATTQPWDDLHLINIHAPSGSGARQLKDRHRRQLIDNLLQRPSLQNPKNKIGLEGNFLTGGDMNTPPTDLSAILSQAYTDGKVKAAPIVLTSGVNTEDMKHGDLCFMQGIISESLHRGKAKNHDPRHDPYGIKWTPIATQQMVPEAFPVPECTSSTATDSASTARHGHTMQLARNNTGATQHGDHAVAIERSSEANERDGAAMPSATQIVVTAGLNLIAPPRWAATDEDDETRPWAEPMGVNDAETEPDSEPNIGSDETESKKHYMHRAEELVYSVLNAMLNKVSYRNETAETVLREAVKKKIECPQLQEQMQLIGQVFAPVFYDFGAKKEHEKKPDQWILKPQCTLAYIQNWREYNAKRVRWNREANLEPFQLANETQFLTIIQAEKAMHEKNLAAKNLSVTKKNIHSSFHAKLRDETGDKQIAYSIWKIGMPEPSQWCHQIEGPDVLTEAVSTGLAEDANTILDWLYKVADIAQSLKAGQSSHR